LQPFHAEAAKNRLQLGYSELQPVQALAGHLQLGYFGLLHAL